jgi:hypothetical protein
MLNAFDPTALTRFMKSSAGASTFAKMDIADRVTIFGKLPKNAQGDLFKRLPDDVQADLLRNVDAGTAAKLGKADGLSRTETAMLVGGAAAIGVGVYLDDKAAKQSKKVKECTGLCLPSNWDDYEYGDLEKTDLTYKSLESINKDYPDENVDAKQPFCTAKQDDCGDYCLTKCKSIHEKDLLPGGPLLNRGVDAASNVLKAINPFQALFGDMGGLAWIPSAILIVIIIIFLAMVVF